ncbi:MAG: hypothetical protein WCQ95_06200 [Bacteroidota bacterium]
MRKLKIICSILATATVALILTQSCKKSSQANISASNGTKSHNMGQNCMNCHKSGGSGTGTFTVAGTVYDAAMTATNGNGTLHLFTGASGTGTVTATIDVDSKGNFFTTESVDFTSGLYPAITGTSGNTKFMVAKATSGQCNSCHGSTTDKIWVN